MGVSVSSEWYPDWYPLVWLDDSEATDSLLLQRRRWLQTQHRKLSSPASGSQQLCLIDANAYLKLGVVDRCWFKPFLSSAEKHIPMSVWPSCRGSSEWFLTLQGRPVRSYSLSKKGLSWLRLIIPPTHHDAAVCHGDVFKRLDAEGPTALLSLLGLSAQGTSSNEHPWVFCLLWNQDGIKSDGADPRVGGLS